MDLALPEIQSKGFWKQPFFRGIDKTPVKNRGFVPRTTYRYSSQFWWTIQDSNLRTQAAARPASAADLRAMRAQIEATSSRRGFRKTKQPPFRVTVSFGGRYKTRTCDLPHVKRMRYQLRQSSVPQSLFIIARINPKVKHIFSHPLRSFWKTWPAG